MTNNTSKRVQVSCSVSTKIVLPRVPSSLMLDGGGQIDTKILDDETLHQIADLWREEFLVKARSSFGCS